MRRWFRRPSRKLVGITILILALPLVGIAAHIEHATIEAALMKVPVAGALTLAAAMLVTIGTSLVSRRSTQDIRKPISVLSRWWLLSGAVVIITCTTLATIVFLSIAGTNASLRLEAIKSGLTIGAGAAGLIALILGIRKQWLGERTQFHQEYDATEKRVTELYSKAVDQLGSDKPAVRLGGIYALERVAQNNPEHRQTIVEVLCAYLRMPPETSHTDRDTVRSKIDDISIDEQEKQVRRAIQQVLHRHVETGFDADSFPPSYWPDIDLDLSGARLYDFDLSDCQVRHAIFTDAIFRGDAYFSFATIEGMCLFERCIFENRAFFTSIRTDDGIFDGTIFADRAVFDRASFLSGASFSRAEFDSEAQFKEARIARVFSLDNTVFTNSPGVEKLHIDGRVEMGQARCDGEFDLTGLSYDKDSRAPRSWPQGWLEKDHPDRKGYGLLVRDDMKPKR